MGQVHKNETVELKIPADVRDGMKLRLQGMGEPGEGGGDRGDLHLVLRLDEDDSYDLVDGELEVRVTGAPWEAFTGTGVDVRTARGTVTLKVPSGWRWCTVRGPESTQTATHGRSARGPVPSARLTV